MSGAVSRGGEVGQRGAAVAVGQPGRARPHVRRRRAATTVLVLVVLAAGAGIAWAAGAFRPQGSSGTGQGAPPPATQAVGPVLAATSDQHVVMIPLSTAQESEVAVGDAVTVTLPGGASTPGKISSVGTVASGMVSNATIEVTVTLAHPSAAGTLDQAPVTVYVTTASSPGPVLAVPVGALVAQVTGEGEAGAGYAVEVIGAGGIRHLVAVTAGIFDDNSGMVQVTGALTPGEQVVVPAT